MKNSVEPLLPVLLGRDRIPYARGMRAGNWVFLTGQMGQDFTHGIGVDVRGGGMPHAGVPRYEREAARLFANASEVLRAAGSSLAHLVRVDQYYPTPNSVDPYHVVRRRETDGAIPPSTSMLVEGLLLPEAAMDVQMLAAIPPGGSDTPSGLQLFRHPELDGTKTSGYSPAAKYDDLVFVAGVLASPKPGMPRAPNGLAAEAAMPEQVLWQGQPIKLESEYVLREKIVPSLKLAGAELQDVVKAQVYLTEVEDCAPFMSVWRKWFGENAPATTVVICGRPSIGLAAARVEINLIAVSGKAKRKQVIDGGVALPFEGLPQAVRAADFLFLSGLMAVDVNGLLRDATPDPDQPWFGGGAEAEADAIIENARKLCAAGGTDLANVVRIQIFLSDISLFPAVCRAWRKALPGRPLPFSAVEVAAMSVPGCTVLMDLWVYAPRQGE